MALAINDSGLAMSFPDWTSRPRMTFKQRTADIPTRVRHALALLGVENDDGLRNIDVRAARRRPGIGKVTAKWLADLRDEAIADLTPEATDNPYQTGAKTRP